MPWPDSHDPEVFEAIDREVERQNTGLQLIASENFTSPAVMSAVGSVLTNKYSEGYPGKRYYGGNEIVDDIEDLARERVKALFGAEAANVQPHSGANANLGVYLALLEAGDTVLGLSLDHGGHLTHGSPVNISGRFYDFVSYGVTPSDERIDYDQIRDLAREHRPRMIVAGATAYPRVIDPAPIREICDEVGALFLFDAAHIAGLIAGGAHPNPVPYADVVTFTTHKTLRGPRGGCILSTAEHAAAIDKAIFPGLQGGPLEHVIAGKAVAFREAADPSFSAYAHQIVANAQALASALGAEGIRLVSGGHRQPPAAGRPAVGRRGADRQGRPARTGSCGHHAEQEHGPRRSAFAVRDLGAADRHAGGDDPGDGRGRDGARRGAHGPGPALARRPGRARRGPRGRPHAVLEVHAVPDADVRTCAGSDRRLAPAPGTGRGGSLRRRRCGAGLPARSSRG